MGLWSPGRVSCPPIQIKHHKGTATAGDGLGEPSVLEGVLNSNLKTEKLNNLSLKVMRAALFKGVHE